MGGSYQVGARAKLPLLIHSLGRPVDVREFKTIMLCFSILKGVGGRYFYSALLPSPPIFFLSMILSIRDSNSRILCSSVNYARENV